MSHIWAFFGTVYRYLWFFINFWWQLWSATILIRPAPRCHPRLGMGPTSCSEELGATTIDRWGTSQGIHPHSLLDSLLDSLLAFAPLRPPPLCCPITEFCNWGDFLGSPTWECNQKYKPVATAISKHQERLRQQRGTQFLRSMNFSHCSILICFLWLFLNRKIIAWLQCVNASQ